ncbi:MAG: hypothetical protein HC899_37205 [Leptolyngbyaceae cyanobacterium SM1_4_3]|nr:hypothetical protein [Leptolyngbyaceae cyanobacterium SM1_4_3]
MTLTVTYSSSVLHHSDTIRHDTRRTATRPMKNRHRADQQQQQQQQQQQKNIFHETTRVLHRNKTINLYVTSLQHQPQQQPQQQAQQQAACASGPDPVRANSTTHTSSTTTAGEVDVLEALKVHINLQKVPESNLDSARLSKNKSIKSRIAMGTI